MTSIGLFHLVVSLTALGSGAMVFFRRKGTRQHRQLGWVYLASMLSLNVSALLIYRLFGGFGPFHVAAIISLVTVLFGLRTAIISQRRRRAGRPRDPKWIEHHYFWMAYSYVGLMAAAVSEVATRVPMGQSGAAFGITVAVASILVFVGGSRLIKKRAPAIIASFTPRHG